MSALVPEIHKLLRNLLRWPNRKRITRMPTSSDPCGVRLNPKRRYLAASTAHASEVEALLAGSASDLVRVSGSSLGRCATTCTSKDRTTATLWPMAPSTLPVREHPHITSRGEELTE